MSVRPNIQSPIELHDGKLTVRGESPLPLFDVLHVVVVQQGKRADGMAEGEPLKASANWTAVLAAGDVAAGAAEALGVEIRVDPFQVTSWSQAVQIQ